MADLVGPEFWVIEESEIEIHPFTGLVEAVRRGDTGHVRGIMSSGLGLDAAPHPLPPMTPPLIEAVCAGHHDMVELFLDRKANLNARDVALGGTALHWAAASGNKDLMATLMERAFDVNSPCYSGQTPLHVAAACGHDNIVRLLLSDNAQPDVVDLRGDTPLHEAAGGGHVPVCDALLSGRANPNVANLDAETPLHVAARRGYSGVVEALLAKGASLDAANAAGITALINSAFFGHDPVVQLLLQRGANARAVDKKRRAALHWAALNDHDATVRNLIGWAADSVRLLDEAGATPLDLAMQADAAHVISILRSLHKPDTKRHRPQ
ncbi:hypothetical protein WJX75_004630 [Coccomyxa subellipsoidea]|uniref:Ankyrin n=1 Tax=Coccomyxa subellipsoidea TaxID=248742 RepID=A0ABR2YY40_9CHLO